MSVYGWMRSCMGGFITVLWFQIALNQEHKHMLSFAPDYDHLPLIAKVEVFEYALQNTEGNDLARVCIILKILIACSSLSSLFLLCLLICYHKVNRSGLWQVLWLKSRTSEIWLERRTNYTRSLAVMSMVCVYLLASSFPSALVDFLSRSILPPCASY